MMIGDRLRKLREEKKLTQGEIEQRSGLLRCYISRVENGHTVPAIDTLERLARALEVPMYQLFHEGEKPTVPSKLLQTKESVVSVNGKDERLIARLRPLLAKMDEKGRKLVLHMAHKAVSLKS